MVTKVVLQLGGTKSRGRAAQTWGACTLAKEELSPGRELTTVCFECLLGSSVC